MPKRFYDIKEVSETLDKSEDEIKQLVVSGNLMEYRDGGSPLYKREEVEKIKSQEDLPPVKSKEWEWERISLVPEEVVPEESTVISNICSKCENGIVIKGKVVICCVVLIVLKSLIF